MTEYLLLYMPSAVISVRFLTDIRYNYIVTNIMIAHTHARTCANDYLTNHSSLLNDNTKLL